jgi:hypothetical protein
VESTIITNNFYDIAFEGKGDPNKRGHSALCPYTEITRWFLEKKGVPNERGLGTSRRSAARVCKDRYTPSPYKEITRWFLEN